MLELITFRSNLSQVNKTIPSSQVVYNQTSSHFGISSLKASFLSHAPPPQYCASAPQKKRQVMVDERHVMTQHISNIAWFGDLRISYL